MIQVFSMIPWFLSILNMHAVSLVIFNSFILINTGHCFPLTSIVINPRSLNYSLKYQLVLLFLPSAFFFFVVFSVYFFFLFLLLLFSFTIYLLLSYFLSLVYLCLKKNLFFLSRIQFSFSIFRCLHAHPSLVQESQPILFYSVLKGH